MQIIYQRGISQVQSFEIESVVRKLRNTPKEERGSPLTLISGDIREVAYLRDLLKYTEVQSEVSKYILINTCSIQSKCVDRVNPVYKPLILCIDL